jgi:CubicO group peptidase (beta-lactamase class C family)
MAGTCHIYAQALSSAQIDSLVALTMKTFDVPGIAVAVLKDGKVVHAKGYGVQSLATNVPVDVNSLFAVASNTKAFTAGALGMLVDEGLIRWDSKVTDVIPEFRLYDPYVTAEFTIRDLLTHRSGLGLGAGDLMIWPDSTDFTRAEIIHNLRYLRPSSAFRTQYDYDNTLYIVAGEVIARVSGMSWEDFIEQRIMAPLGMTHSAASVRRVTDRSMMATPHVPIEGEVRPVGYSLSEQANACGGIWSNISDMCKWLTMLLNGGKYGPGLSQRLFSTQVHEEMWKPQTIIPVRAVYIPYKTHFSSYGLGWVLSDVKGYMQVMHTGGLAGMVTQVLLIPEMKLGILVFTNQQVSLAFTAIANTIKDGYLEIPPMNWVTFYHKRVVTAEANARATAERVRKDIDSLRSNGTGTPDPQQYIGTYKDAWFGEMTISERQGRIWIEAKRSAKLRGEIVAFKGTTCVARWNDRTMDADAYVTFSIDWEGKPSGMTLRPISPLADFSFDFRDLDFKRTSQ